MLLIDRFVLPLFVIKSGRVLVFPSSTLPKASVVVDTLNIELEPVPTTLKVYGVAVYGAVPVIVMVALNDVIISVGVKITENVADPLALTGLAEGVIEAGVKAVPVLLTQVMLAILSEASPILLSVNVMG